jgi:rifampin ADP-ribosylating transferase
VIPKWPGSGIQFFSRSLSGRKLYTCNFNPSDACSFAEITLFKCGVFAVLNEKIIKKNMNESKQAQEQNAEHFYHGTKADLKIGDVIEPGYNSNYGQKKKASYVYLTATLDAATWGAELAQGDAPGRIYIVEPTGEFEDDPNLTDKKFPGNPTKSYRTKHALRVTGEIKDWKGHAPEVLQAMIDHLQRLKELGIEAIED